MTGKVYKAKKPYKKPTSLGSQGTKRLSYNMAQIRKTAKEHSTISKEHPKPLVRDSQTGTERERKILPSRSPEEEKPMTKEILA